MNAVILIMKINKCTFDILGKMFSYIDHCLFCIMSTSVRNYEGCTAMTNHIYVSMTD